MTRQDILDKFTTVSQYNNEPPMRVLNTNAMADEILNLELRINEIRNLHSPESRTFGGTSWKLCTTCRDGEGLMENYPCNTIRILQKVSI